MVNENHPCKYGDVIRPAEDVSHPEKDKTYLEDDVSHPVKDNFHQEDLSHPEVEVSHPAKDFRHPEEVLTYPQGTVIQRSTWVIKWMACVVPRGPESSRGIPESSRRRPESSRGGESRVSFETSFDSKQPKLEPKLVSALSETKRLFQLFRFYTETVSMFRLNRNKQNANRNSLKGSIFFPKFVSLRPEKKFHVIRT